MSVTNYNGYNVSCFDSNDATVSALVDGGVGPYDYSFDGGASFVISDEDGDYDYENLNSGNMIFLVQDDNDCTSEVDFEVTSPLEIIPEVSQVGTLDCFGQSSVSIYAQNDGGSPQYTYTLVLKMKHLKLFHQQLLFHFRTCLQAFTS